MTPMNLKHHQQVSLATCTFMYALVNHSYIRVCYCMTIKVIFINFDYFFTDFWIWQLNHALSRIIIECTLIFLIS